MIPVNAVQRFGEFYSTITPFDRKRLDFVRIYRVFQTGIQELFVVINGRKSEK